MPQALALAHDHVAQIFWNYPEKIEGCLGFAVQRIEDGQPDLTLPAWVGFAGETSDTFQQRDTAMWPVQKFEWRDQEGKPGATYRYRITPMIGAPGALRPVDDPALIVTTEPVTLTDRFGDFELAFPAEPFSADALGRSGLVTLNARGKPDFGALIAKLATPGDALRERLAGSMLRVMTKLPKAAADEGGTIYAALSELSDPDLLAALMAAPKLRLILSNTGGKDDTANAAARAALHERARQKGPDWEIIDRFVPGGHKSHNKYVVLVGADGVPRAVQTGTANFTTQAITLQSNIAMIAWSRELAAGYLERWNLLREDTLTGARLGRPLRVANKAPVAAQIGASPVRAWFSPNMLQQSKPKRPRTPPDMAEVFKAMSDAEHCALFLAFMPGRPGIMNHVRNLARKRPDLVIRGAVTNGKAAQRVTRLLHRAGEHAATVVGSAQIRAENGPLDPAWLDAIAGGHALIHDKVIVIDPMGANPVVILGSHNLGFNASFSNDENLLVIRKCPELARAIAVHIMDVYGSYRWRWMLHENGRNTVFNLDADDGWQNKYHDPKNAASQDKNIWVPPQSPPAGVAPIVVADKAKPPRPGRFDPAGSRRPAGGP